MNYNQQQYVFPSGLRLVFVKTPNFNTAKFKLVIEVGAEDEQKSNGVAHLLEHSVFKGTKNLSQEAISEKFNFLSAEVDASTSSEFTVYKSSFPKRNLIPVLGLFSEILSKSVFNKTEIEKEKQVIIEEILMHEDNPDQLAFDTLVKMMYADVGVGNDIAGEIENLKKVSIKDLKTFHATHYASQNFLISVVGDFEFEEIIKVVNAYFEKVFFNKNATRKIWSNKSLVKPAKKDIKKDINQANILIGFKTIPYESFDRIKLGLIGFILGGSMSSRLFKKIRNDLSLCYSVYAFDMNYKNNGFLGISLATTAQNKEKAIQAVNQEIEKIVNFGVTEEEFNVAKNLTLDKYLMNKDYPNVALSYLSYTGELFNENEMIEKLDKTTKEEALEEFRKYIQINKEFVVTVAPN